MKRATLLRSLILATLASAAPLAHSQYTAYDLGFGEAYGINDSGVVVGYSGNTHRAFSYSGGVMADLGVLGGAYSSAQGINSVGTIVGDSTLSGSSIYGFSYSGGHMTGLLGGTSSHATGINNAGTIVGYVYYGDWCAFRSSGGVMTLLGTLGGTTSVAYGINSAGTIVGRSCPSGSSIQHAFSYSSGHMTDLGTLGGMPHKR